MRGSVATEREYFCIFIRLNAALFGPPEPKSELQSLVSICYTFFGALFLNFPWGGGGVTLPPPHAMIGVPALHTYFFWV